MIHSDKDINNNDNIIPQPIDSIIEVIISHNKLEASVNVKPPEHGGKSPNIQTIREVLDSKNISYGVNVKRLLEICKNPNYNTDILVAKGVAPINGIDGTFSILFDTAKNSKPIEKEDGTVDFYNLENVENVKEGQLLCTITHPIEGKDGISVSRDIIPYIKGKAVASILGKNTKLSADGTKVFASMDGQVDYSQGRINVFETLYIKENVDNSTGNINVAGNVIISGRVLSGFMVQATGNIQIHGGLGSVRLIAGGDIILRGGIIGGNISCEGDLTSKFIENCKVFVKGDIKTDYIMNSNVQCGKNLYAINSISKIVGGRYLVGENIEANIIGSKANVKTYIELGTDPLIINRQLELTKDIPLLETKKHSLESLISLLKQFQENNRLTIEKKQMLDNAIFSYSEINELIDSGKLELEKITDSIKSKGYGRVLCRGIMHSGTTIRIGSAQTSIKEAIFAKSLYYSEDGICMGKAAPSN